MLLCRLTQQDFLRLANNPRVFPTDAVSMTGAWRLYDITMTDPRVAFASEPATLADEWRKYTQGPGSAPIAWNDAYLAAFAEACGYEAVTFDKGFAQFANLKVTILT
jgi:predicted nucleic acid-binding protein